MKKIRQIFKRQINGTFKLHRKRESNLYFSRDPILDITIRNNCDVSANVPLVFCECSLPNKSSVLQILHKCSASVPRVFLRILQRVNNILQSCSPVKSCRGFFYHSWQVYSWLTDFPPLGRSNGGIESGAAFLFLASRRILPRSRILAIRYFYQKSNFPISIWTRKM